MVGGHSAGTTSHSKATLVRYDAGGSLDAGFGSGGIATLEGSLADAEVYALALQPDGKIVVAGNDGGRGLLLARYTPGGTLDQGFGAGGRVLTQLNGYTYATGVAIQPDGRIVADGPDAGRRCLHLRRRAVRRRRVGRSQLRPAGRVVSRLVALPKLVSGTAAGVVLQADGKIVVGGTLQQLTGGASPAFGLARYLVTPGCRVPDVRQL